MSVTIKCLTPALPVLMPYNATGCSRLVQLNSILDSGHQSHNFECFSINLKGLYSTIVGETGSIDSRLNAVHTLTSQ